MGLLRRPDGLLAMTKAEQLKLLKNKLQPDLENLGPV